LPWWRWPNVLSLDAPVIAVVWQEAFARAFGAPLNLPQRVALFLAVWCVYAADRVADGLRLGAPPEASARHRFAARHWRVFVPAIGLGGLVCVGLAPFLTVRVLGGGAVLAALVGVYFLWNQFAKDRFARGWAKELVVGVVFAGGCALAPWMAAPSALKTLPVLVFALVCTANCLLIARLEREIDIRRGESSLAVRLPAHLRPARTVVAVAGILALVLPGMGLALRAALGLAALGIWSGAAVERRFGPEFACTWADAVLLSPLLVLPFLA